MELRLKAPVEGEPECVVRIYGSIEEMQAAVADLCQVAAVNEKGGAFTWIERASTLPQVFFCDDYLTLDFVAHEFFHAAIVVAARNGVEDFYAEQESFVTLAGEWIRLFWNAYLGLGEEYHIKGTLGLFQKNFELAKMAEEV